PPGRGGGSGGRPAAGRDQPRHQPDLRRRPAQPRGAPPRLRRGALRRARPRRLHGLVARRGALRLGRRARDPDPSRRRARPRAPGVSFLTDKKPEVDSEAPLAPDSMRYPAVPLAFQTTSPFIPARPVEPVEAPAEAPQQKHDEPWGLLDVVDPPDTYGVDELALMARDPWTLFAWWE